MEGAVIDERPDTRMSRKTLRMFKTPSHRLRLIADRKTLHTWMLFLYVFLGWGISDNAIFLRDAGRIPIWRSVVQRIAHLRTAWVLGILVVGIVGILCVKNPLFILLPPLAVFALALAVILGPVVVEERARLTWEPLLTVPYDLRAILLGKASGALWHIRSLTYVMGILLMCVSAGVGSIGLTLIPMSIARTSSWFGVGLCGVLFFTPVLGSLLFLVDRIQQYALMAMAALASGTKAPSIRAALSTATTAVLLIWLFEIAVTEVLLALEQGRAWRLDFTSMLSVATLGPTASYLSQMDLSHAIGCIVGTLLVREMVIGGLWRWTLHNAQI